MLLGPVWRGGFLRVLLWLGLLGVCRVVLLRLMLLGILLVGLLRVLLLLGGLLRRLTLLWTI